MRVGLLGGTFNPPHLGHLICAQEALVQLGLERVRLIPAAAPPHKAVPDDPGVRARLRMCELAVEGDERFEVSAIEAGREGPSYTVDTLRALRDREPEHELTFIVGGDMAHSLPEWHEPEAVLALAELGVAERAEIRRAAIEERLATLAGGRERVRFFSMPRLDLSSTDVRRRAAAGAPVRYLVPDRVASYIEHEGLYR